MELKKENIPAAGLKAALRLICSNFYGTDDPSFIYKTQSDCQQTHVKYNMLIGIYYKFWYFADSCDSICSFTFPSQNIKNNYFCGVLDIVWNIAKVVREKHLEHVSVLKFYKSASSFGN